MIDTKAEKQDWFHHGGTSILQELAEARKLQPDAHPPIVQKCEFYMKYVPQGVQAYKVKTEGHQFTEDKIYPVLEKTDFGAHCIIKTIDDSGKERWIKDDYFVPAVQKLLAEKECRWFSSEGTKITQNLSFANELNGEMPDLRKLAKEKKLEEIKKEPTVVLETNVLAGVASMPTVTEEEILTGVKRKSKAQKADGSDYWGGNNPLLQDLDKLIENMGKVFPEYRKVDTDGLMIYIKDKLRNRKVEWNNGVLTVDGAKTNIFKADVNVAFDGLKKLTTPKMADKIVGKVIVNKLKKLF
jgi:hypothetical protein